MRTTSDRFRFAFRLSGGGCEYHVFTASTYPLARAAAEMYARAAFAPGELRDFSYLP